MINFFKQVWDIEMQRFNLFLEYWYVWIIVFGICGIAIWKINKN